MRIVFLNKKPNLQDLTASDLIKYCKELEDDIDLCNFAMKVKMCIEGDERTVEQRRQEDQDIILGISQEFYRRKPG